jgi:serine/threonine-protein kinase
MIKTPGQSGEMAILEQEIVETPFGPGDVIAGKYEVLNLVGTGGMGYVVSARHLELGELVALKFLRREAQANEELAERFAREARAAARIKSEHVVRVFDVGTLPDGVPFIVMEHLEGEDLGSVLERQGRLPIKTAVEYVMQACEGLASAHVNGVVHRDVKPENLFLTRQAGNIELIKILDFGISKVALGGLAGATRRQMIRTSMPMGSPIYMSPEQIRSSDTVDARTDIWSLGCVLFELLTEVTPFDAPSVMQVGAAILEQEPTRLRSLLPDAPAELEAVILRCLNKDVSKRYTNVAELAVELYAFAPRRARIFAERCNSLLAGRPLEILSTAPPPRETPKPARAEVAAVSHVARIEPSVPPAPAKANPWKGALIGLAVLGSAAAGYLTFRQVHEAPAASATLSVQPMQSEAAPERAGDGEPAAAPGAPSGADRAPAANPTEAGTENAGAASAAGAAAAKARAPNNWRPRRPAPPPPVKGKPVRTTSSDEPDVGF